MNDHMGSGVMTATNIYNMPSYFSKPTFQQGRMVQSIRDLLAPSRLGGSKEYGLQLDVFFQRKSLRSFCKQGLHAAPHFAEQL